MQQRKHNIKKQEIPSNTYFTENKLQSDFRQLLKNKIR